MSGNLITTLLILLSEIVLILIIIGAWILVRRRMANKSPTTEDSGRQDPNMPTDRPPPEPAVLGYISSMIVMTEELLAGLSADQTTEQIRLQTRLMALQAEKALFLLPAHDADHAAFWETLNHYYDNNGDLHRDHGPHTSSEAPNEACKHKLQDFRALFLDSQQQLKNSFNIINELKSRLVKLPDMEENRQLEDMVNELSLDNINLSKKLAQAQQYIQELLDDMNDPQTTANPPVTTTIQDYEDTDLLHDRIQTLEDENEFLCTQIQHLLQQEVENTQAMAVKMAELEMALQQATGDDAGIASGST